MPVTKISKYIIGEVLSPTLLCLLIFTVVLLMGRLMKLVDLVVNKGVAIFDIMALFGTMLPAFLNITLPLSFLMGIMIGLSRMSSDCETIALKAAGVGLAQMARPILVLAVIFALLTAVAGLWLKPVGYQAFRERVFAITMQKATVGFQPQVFMKQFDNMVLYANELDARTGRMHGLFIVERKPDATMQIFAEEGEILTNEKEETLTFRLRDGTIHRQKSDDDSTYQLIHFRSYDVQPDLTSNGDDNSGRIDGRKRPKEMSTGQLWQQLNNGDSQLDRRKIGAAEAELHTRLATPMAPIIFALFGLPFSIQTHRSGRSGGFVVGLIIYLCYYLLLSLAQTFTADAGVTPWLSFWLPHLLLGLAGLYCLYRSAHEQPSVFVYRVEQTMTYLKNLTDKSHDHA
jgi:lipopolysaccharide export system permease protein